MRTLKASTRSSVFIVRFSVPVSTGAPPPCPSHRAGYFLLSLLANSHFLGVRLRDHADVIIDEAGHRRIFADGCQTLNRRPARVISFRPASRSRHGRTGPCLGRSTSSAAYPISCPSPSSRAHRPYPSCPCPSCPYPSCPWSLAFPRPSTSLVWMNPAQG